MRLGRGRIALLAVLVVALAALATTATWLGTRGSQHPPVPAARYHGGPGMTDEDDSGGMMGGWGDGDGTGGSVHALPGDGGQVGSIDAARSRAQAFADRLALRVGEVIQFDNGFYAELLGADGRGATEVLVDPGNGAVGLEQGPAMMWNARYGMHPQAQADPATVTAAAATRTAERWLADRKTGLSVGEAEAFPGYYTMETLRDGTIVSMMSVNAYTGAVWYHTWHGRYIASEE